MVAMMFVPLLLAYQASLNQQKFVALFYSICLIASITALILFAAYYLPLVGRLLSSTRGFLATTIVVFLIFYQHLVSL